MYKRPIDRLCRYGFYLSVLLVLYGALFPFQFVSTSHEFLLIPYWDIGRGRIHSLPDLVSNILLTMPLGFLGFLWFDRGRKLPAIAKWLLLGLLLGLLSEIVQTRIPSRTSDMTDVLNNGLGAFFGALGALLFGQKILGLLSDFLLNRKGTYFVILLGIAVTGALLPFDLSMDVGHILSSLKQLWMNPWETGSAMKDEWIQMAVFAMIGALACKTKPRLTAIALALPFILEPMQLLVESHDPSLRSAAVNFAGVAAGIATAWLAPSLVRPATGFILMNIALAARGLSPYGFSGQSDFQWIPLAEYCQKPMAMALHDAMAAILDYALLAALWPRRTTILWGIALAAGIEFTQMFVPPRSAGITDILIAALGCWAGYVIRKSLDSPVVEVEVMTS
jgi:VanZ family protein